MIDWGKCEGEVIRETQAPSWRPIQIASHVKMSRFGKQSAGENACFRLARLPFCACERERARAHIARRSTSGRRSPRARACGACPAQRAASIVAQDLITAEKAVTVESR
eukprot:6213722-Pleurochrysis_carterae.AAC.3